MGLVVLRVVVVETTMRCWAETPEGQLDIDKIRHRPTWVWVVQPEIGAASQDLPEGPVRMWHPCQDMDLEWCRSQHQGLGTG